jgi:sigma-E factor negative regulatory protein RseC
LLEGRNPDDYRIGDEIQIGIPDDVVVKASILAYVMPLILMLSLTILAHYLFNSEAITALGALGGLLLGGFILRWHAQRNRYDSRFQPVLVDGRKPLTIYEPAHSH